MRRTLLALLTLASLYLPAHATSTINPTTPAQSSTITSAIVRNNFAAAYNDVNNILGKFASSTAPTNQTALQDWVDKTTSPVYVFKMWNPTTSAWVSWATLNINTNAFSIISTAGSFLATPPLTVGVSGGGVVTYGLNLDSNFASVGGNLALASIGNGHLLANCGGGAPAEPGNCTWNNYANQAIGSVDGTLPYRTGGSWSTASTGVSGHALPFLDAANTFSAAQTIYPGASALPTAISGTLLEIVNNDGTNTRLTMTSAGASTLVTGRASLGTLAIPLTLTSGTLITSLNATGYDGTSWTTSGANGAFRIYAEGTWSNTSHPTEACIGTTPSASLSISDILCVHANGGVTIGALTSNGLGTLNAASIVVNNAVIIDSSGNVTGTTVTSAGNLTTATNLVYASKSIIQSATDGDVTLLNNAATGFTSLKFGGSTASFPEIKRNGAAINFRLADDSADAAITASTGVFSSTLASAAYTITSASASALSVGLNGATNSAFRVDASTASQVAGLKLTGAVTGGTVALLAIDSGSNTSISLNTKGTGTLSLNNVATGGVVIGAPTGGDKGSGTLNIGTALYINGSAVTGTGTVTSVTCGTGLSGGAITTSGTCAVNLSVLTNSLGSDVAMNNTANYFDGPSVAQGTSGTWFASGTVTLIDTTSVANLFCKLWDGTTTFASVANRGTGANNYAIATLSGFITSPAGNIRISCRDATNTTASILFNATGLSKDSTVTAVRIQ